MNSVFHQTVSSQHWSWADFRHRSPAAILQLHINTDVLHRAKANRDRREWWTFTLEWLTALLRICRERETSVSVHVCVCVWESAEIFIHTITSAEHQRNTEKHTVKSDTHDCSGSVWNTQNNMKHSETVCREMSDICWSYVKLADGHTWRADSVCGSSASISGCFSWFSSSYKHFTPSTPSSFHRHTVKHPPTHTHTFRRMTSQVWERVCGISEVRQLE